MSRETGDPERPRRAPATERPRRRTPVGVRELRQNLSVHLRRVAKGEVLEVTERGRPVALLAPLPEAMGPIQRLALEGRLAQAPRGRIEDLPPPHRLKLRRPLSQVLVELREDRI